MMLLLQQAAIERTVVGKKENVLDLKDVLSNRRRPLRRRHCYVWQQPHVHIYWHSIQPVLRALAAKVVGGDVKVLGVAIDVPRLSDGFCNSSNGSL